MSSQKSPWVLIGSDELSAGIDPIGAQLSVLRDRSGRDLLWNGDPSVWNGRAPLLFPIVGALAGGTYRLDSKAYPLSRHGFARGRVFEVASASRAGALFRLQADAASLQVYPFRFQLEIDFAIDGPSLAVTARISNLGDEHMPASFGYHPAFRWPLPYGQARAAHFIEFEAPEAAPVRRLDAGGLLTPEHHPSPINDRRLALDDALFEHDVIIFDALRSRSVEYGADAGPRLRVSFADAPFLGIWTKPRADFICIEPWHGVADPQAYAGEFRAKPGVFSVAPRCATAIRMEITLLLL
jgi:galactose mutarotase-like enzyme